MFERQMTSFSKMQSWLHSQDPAPRTPRNHTSVSSLLLDGVTLGIVPAPLAGWEIFVVGLLAWYIATATLTNAVYGRKVLPLS